MPQGPAWDPATPHTHSQLGRKEGTGKEQASGQSGVKHSPRSSPHQRCLSACPCRIWEAARLQREGRRRKNTQELETQTFPSTSFSLIQPPALPHSQKAKAASSAREDSAAPNSSFTQLSSITEEDFFGKTCVPLHRNSCSCDTMFDST